MNIEHTQYQEVSSASSSVHVLAPLPIEYFRAALLVIIVYTSFSAVYMTIFGSLGVLTLSSFGMTQLGLIIFVSVFGIANSALQCEIMRKTIQRYLTFVEPGHILMGPVVSLKFFINQPGWLFLREDELSYAPARKRPHQVEKVPLALIESVELPGKKRNKTLILHYRTEAGGPLTSLKLFLWYREYWKECIFDAKLKLGQQQASETQYPRTLYT